MTDPNGYQVRRKAAKRAEVMQHLQSQMDNLLPPMTLDGKPVTGVDQARLPFVPGKYDWTSAEVDLYQAALEARWAEDDRAHQELIASGVATPRANEESPFPNPYWDEVKKIPGDPINLKYERGWEPEPFSLHGTPLRRYRDELVRQYAWAITAPESVQFVAEHAGPHGLVEIGAGTGYWAWCLSHLGVDVVAYDKAPPASGPNWYHSPMEPMKTAGGAIWHRPRQVATREWVPVRKGRPWHASRWPHRTLFLCWPPYTDLMAHSSLRQYRGNRLIYIGEGEGGCNAGRAFFSRLAAEWDEVATHKPVQWSGLHDWIIVYERAAEPRPWPHSDDHYGYDVED